MDLDETRIRFWNEFIALKENKTDSPIFKVLKKPQLNKSHALEIYNQYGFRLVIGINEEYARCSFHIKGRNHKDVRSQLRIIIEKLNKQFQLKRNPEIFIKENPKSIVLVFRDHGYRFPPRNLKEKEALMEWMYLNAIVMNEIPAYFEEKNKLKTKSPVAKNLIPSKIEKIAPATSLKKIEAESITELENLIYHCKSDCKMPKERMLLGTPKGGDLYNTDNIELMLIGIGPNSNYAEKKIKREVFGGYGNSGRRVNQLIAMLERKRESLSYWKTNAIKCDYEFNNKKKEKATILACNKYLMREIEIIHPKVIVLFGLRLSEIFLNKRLVHGEVSIRDGYIYIQSNHPARGNWDEKLKILAPKILKYL